MNSVLDPAGPQAAHILALWWVMLAACAVVFVAVIVAIAWALWRAPRADEETAPDVADHPVRERRAGRGVTIAVIASSILLVALLAASFATDRALAQLPLADALPVHVVGHQYWWEVTYDEGDASRAFTTANELRIPVGRSVVVRLDAEDVIHSLWIPSLHGKKDLIPGMTNILELRADRAGTFVGRCAEFCGDQHAFMAIDVVALPPAEYEAWADAQRRLAPQPAGAIARHGLEVFMDRDCGDCHAVRGTRAAARKAPDLTHVAGRMHLVAGRMGNSPEELALWITDPQRVKPGAKMPAHQLARDDLKALVAYLETLQ